MKNLGGTLVDSLTVADSLRFGRFGHEEKEEVLHGAPPLRLPTTVKFGEIRGDVTAQILLVRLPWIPRLYACTNCNWSLFTPPLVQ